MYSRLHLCRDVDDGFTTLPIYPLFPLKRATQKTLRNWTLLSQIFLQLKVIQKVSHDINFKSLIALRLSTHKIM